MSVVNPTEDCHYEDHMDIKEQELYQTPKALDLLEDRILDQVYPKYRGTLGNYLLEKPWNFISRRWRRTSPKQLHHH